jgi:methionyl aminopeptidase
LIITTPEEVLALKRIGGIVARVLEQMLAALEPGMTTGELDALGERALAAAGARSAPRLTYNFPGATCISVNEEVAHGIPGERVIAAGDVVNVDVSAELDGYFGDTGGTRVVPPSNELKDRLCATTRAALDAALAVVRAGERINVIGKAIEAAATAGGFRVVENLGSHGIGRKLHDSPGFIQGYDDPDDRRLLKEGMVITIEPFLSTRSRRLRQAADGWTLRGAPDNLSAQYEHTLIITRGAPILCTL